MQNEQQLSLANKANESALAYQEEVLKNTLNETKQLRDQLRSLKEEKVESLSSLMLALMSLSLFWRRQSAI